jgi:hypothetical protein
MRTPFDRFGKGGVIFDQPPWDLEDAAWSSSVNFRFRDGAAEAYSGQSPIFGTPLGAAQRLFTMEEGAQSYWVYAGTNRVWATDGAVHAEITSLSASYSASDELLWNGGAFQSQMLLNNGRQTPQAWTPSLSTRLTELANWEAGTLADVVRSYRNFIFAFRVTEAGVYNPRLLRHSNGAIAGNLPTSWDYTDPNEDTGRVEFGQTDDLLVDALPLRDQFVIYKQRHIWAAQYAGGVDNPFIYHQAFSNVGALGQYCVANFDGYHIVLSPDDVVMHDLNQVSSVVDKRTRAWLFRQINPEKYQTCFVVANPRDREAWICFPESGHNRPNLALIWNWSENTHQVRELGVDTPHIAFGIVQDTSGSTFDTDVGTFDGAVDTFDGAIPNAAATSLVIADPDNVNLLHVDVSGTLNGQVFTKRLEREALPFGNLLQVKRIHRIYPKLIGLAGEVVRILIGTRERFEDVQAYSTPVNFTIGTDLWAEFRTSGRLIDIRFEYDGVQALRIHGFDVEWEAAGIR